MKKLLYMLVMLLLCSVAAAEQENLIETILYEGKATVSSSWTLAASVNTTNSNGSFDPSLISEGGYFTVEYTGTESGIYLALSEWQDGIWAQADQPETCRQEGDVFIATFTYEQCFNAFKRDDFDAIDQICIGTGNSNGDTTILRIVWHGRPLQDDLNANAVLFRGSATSRSADSNMAFVFTKHVGGEFDSAQINRGSSFYVEYSGAKNGVYLALSSHSGAVHWSRVNADETKALDNGRFAAIFHYDNFAKAWGENFARLDQISVFSNTSTEVTVYRIAYFAGDGAPVDMTDGRWDRPDTGIAFIGDSICQNAQLIYGDWNTILGRSDCVNFGIGAQTTKDCLARIDELASRDYSMVVFICGINDIGRGYTSEEIVGNYDGMISAIRAQNADCKYLLVSVLPTTSAFYYGQQHRIVELNAAYQAYAETHADVAYADVYSSFTDQAGNYAYPELLSDGLHPNGNGYAVMSEILSSYLPE